MYGYSSLHNAVVTQDLKAVRSLTGPTRTCELESRDSMGFTALHLATLQGNKDLIEMLVLAGCDVNSRTKEGMTSLHISSEQSRADEILRILASASCNVNERNKLGRTALHLAAKLGNLQNLKALIDNGCDRNIKDKLGFTAVGLAFKFNQKASADILLHYKSRRKRRSGGLGETTSEESLYQEDASESCQMYNGEDKKIVEERSSMSSKKLDDKTSLKFIRWKENREASLKTLHLIMALLTHKRNVLDGLTNCYSSKKRASVEINLPDLIFTSLFQYPLATHTSSKLNDKSRTQCVCDFYLKPREIERSRIILVKLLQGVKDSISFSRDKSLMIPKQHQSLPSSSKWKLQEKDLKVKEEKLSTAPLSNTNANPSIWELNSMHDKTTLTTLCEDSTLMELCEESPPEVDNEGLKKNLEKLNKLMISVKDSDNTKTYLDCIDSGLITDDIDIYLSRLDDVIAMKSTPTSFIEATLEIFSQNLDISVYCAKKRDLLFSSLLEKIITGGGSWDADKIAKIFLHVCVAFVSDQRLLFSCAGAVLKLGLCHSQSNAVALGTCILVRMGLLKQEDYVDIVKDLTGPLLALEHLCAEEYFPRNLAAIFASFLSKSSPRLFGMDHLRLRALASAITKEVLSISCKEAESDMGKNFKRVCDIVALEGYREELLSCVDALFSRAFVTLGCNAWRIGESILIYLGLLKGELHVETVRNHSSALKLLLHVLKQSYCPPILKQLLVCFLQKPNPLLTSYSSEVEDIFRIIQ